MSDDGIKFIYIVNVAIVVYNNGINMKILMSPWKRPTKIPQPPFPRGYNPNVT